MTDESDRMQDIAEDIACLTVIAEKLNAISDALRVLEEIPWPGATEVQKDRIAAEISHIIGSKIRLEDVNVEAKAAYTKKVLGFEAPDPRRIGDSSSTETTLKSIRRMKEERRCRSTFATASSPPTRSAPSLWTCLKPMADA